MITFALYRILIKYYYIDRALALSIRKWEKKVYKMAFVILVFYGLIFRNQRLLQAIKDNTDKYIEKIERHLITANLPAEKGILNVEGLVMLVNDNEIN